MKEYGYVRVGASVPKMEVANPIFNVKEIKAQIDLAISRQIDILVFPELSITGYTCGDLFVICKLISVWINEKLAI